MEHHAETLDVDATPTGTTRELGVVARSEHLVTLPVELAQRLEDYRLRRHVDPERQGLRGEDDLEEPELEQLLHGLLERRDHPRVMSGDTGLETGDPPAEIGRASGRERR